MRYAFIPLMAIALILTSCSTQNGIIPKLMFGQAEPEWRGIEKALVTEGVFVPRLNFDKDTVHLFKWKLGDTSYVMQVFLNGDADKEGSLRMYSLGLTQDTLPETKSNGKIEQRSSGFAFYSPSTIEDLRNRISSEFGQPDSISSSDGDSSFWYKEKEFNLEMQIPKPQLSTTGPFYFAPKAFVYSKTYTADYEKFTADKRKALTAKDLLSVDLNSPEQTTISDEYGLPTQILEITSFLESSPSHLNDKNITSAKGTLRILDNYNDVLLELEDHEYTLSSPLCCGRSWVIQGGKYGWSLSLANRPENRKVREAIQRGSTLKAEFEPKTILFSDGTVWR